MRFRNWTLKNSPWAGRRTISDKLWPANSVAEHGSSLGLRNAAPENLKDFRNPTNSAS